MARSRRGRKSSNWRARQERDPFVRKARQAGYRARAAYKLEEIDRRYRLLRPGARVVDLGSAPGSWSQYAMRRVGARGRVVAVDLLEMPEIDGVRFLRGDFTEAETAAAVLAALDGHYADLVLSDMAPNISGIRLADQARSEALLESVLGFCLRGLRPGGVLLAKMFEGEGAAAVRERAKSLFGVVRTVKPEASRSESRESYLLARNFRGPSSA